MNQESFCTFWIANLKNISNLKPRPRVMSPLPHKKILIAKTARGPPDERWFFKRAGPANERWFFQWAGKAKEKWVFQRPGLGTKKRNTKNIVRQSELTNQLFFFFPFCCCFYYYYYWMRLPIFIQFALFITLTHSYLLW